MTKNRSQIIEFIEQGIIPLEKINLALKKTGIVPDGKHWRSFIDQLLIWTGGLSLAFSILFFVAYNWKNMGLFVKFLMVEVLMVLAIAAYCKWYENNVARKVTLLMAIIILGVLLALYGQTYQTGADPWQLFFNWALLMLPWAMIGRFHVIWIVWVMLINLSIVMYCLTFLRFFGLVFGSDIGMMWILFFFNTFVLTLWQVLAMRWSWLLERWAIRLLAVGSGLPLTWLVLYSIFEYGNVGGLAVVVWGLWLAVMYGVYRRLKPDLFMLAGCCLSAITVTVTFLGKYLFQSGVVEAFFVLAIIVLGMGGGAALWLKHIYREGQA